LELLPLIRWSACRRDSVSSCSGVGRAHSLRGDADANDPVFVSRKGGWLSERTVNDTVKRAAKAAGVNEAVSLHWLLQSMDLMCKARIKGGVASATCVGVL
jgi:hypothetical protein